MRRFLTFLEIFTDNIPNKPRTPPQFALLKSSRISPKVKRSYSRHIHKWFRALRNKYQAEAPLDTAPPNKYLAKDKCEGKS
jgi:hypothetical protein